MRRLGALWLAQTQESFGEEALQIATAMNDANEINAVLQRSIF